MLRHIKDKGSKTARVSRLDMSKAIIRLIKPGTLDEEVANYIKICSERGFAHSPCIFSEGENWLNIVTHWVFVGEGQYFPTTTCREALSLCFSVIWSLNYPYPPEALTLWLIIQRLVYNIILTDDPNIPIAYQVVEELSWQ